MTALEKRFDVLGPLPATKELCLPPVGYRICDAATAYRNPFDSLKYNFSGGFVKPSFAWVSMTHYGYGDLFCIKVTL